MTQVDFFQHYVTWLDNWSWQVIIWCCHGVSTATSFIMMIYCISRFLTLYCIVWWWEFILIIQLLSTSCQHGRYFILTSRLLPTCRHGEINYLDESSCSTLCYMMRFFILTSQLLHHYVTWWDKLSWRVILFNSMLHAEIFYLGTEVNFFIIIL